MKHFKEFNIISEQPIIITSFTQIIFYNLNKSIQIMGQVAAKICGSENILDMLMKKYGGDVGKFIAIEKVKQFLQTKIIELKNTIEQQTQKILQQILQFVDSKKAELLSKFNQIKQKINQRLPGGIGLVEKARGQPIENILGLNNALNNFDQIRTTATNKFNEEKNNVFRTIDTTAEQQKQVLNQQRPQIPIYDSLSENQQRVVFKEGEKMFANQIAQEQDTMMKQLGDKLQPETYMGNFKNIVPMGSIDGIFQNGSSSFDMIAQQLLGGGGGNLGGMMQNFQKIF